MVTIRELEPASQKDVTIYMPYYPKEQHRWLPYALSLYQKGSLQGARQIEGGESIAFVAFWDPYKLPSDLTRCQLQFDSQADLSYEVTIINSEFIGYLLRVISNYKESKETDFPQDFYRKLLRLE